MKMITAVPLWLPIFDALVCGVLNTPIFLKYEKRSYCSPLKFIKTARFCKVRENSLVCYLKFSNQTSQCYVRPKTSLQKPFTLNEVTTSLNPVTPGVKRVPCASISPTELSIIANDKEKRNLRYQSHGIWPVVLPSVATEKWCHVSINTHLSQSRSFYQEIFNF